MPRGARDRFRRVHRRLHRRGAPRRGYDVVGHRQPVEVRTGHEELRRRPRYRFVEGDARDVDLLTSCSTDCDHFIAGAALIGGISYFHTYAYDLLATNERIMAAIVRRRHRGPPRRARCKRSPT